MKNKKYERKIFSRVTSLVLLILILAFLPKIIPLIKGTPDTSPTASPTQVTATATAKTTSSPKPKGTATKFDYSLVPESNGITPYVEINDNIPFFSEEDKSRTDPFEDYSKLDQLGRCGVAYANICKELMPTEKRGSISSVKPTGWIQAKYPGIVDPLYNRCHLIGFQLAGENANKLNLITGTRFFNVTAMLVYEDMVDDYVDETNNHVLYRVTPVFLDKDLVARGVLIEAYSVEDHGELQFCVFCYNIQPGIDIDYRTGESKLSEE